MAITFTQAVTVYAPSAGTGTLGVAAGDFSGDGYDDLFLIPFNYPLNPTDLPVSVLQNTGNGFNDVTATVTGGTINVVHPRERIVADFNGDGRDDLFAADHGYDADPFPGHVNTLLLSTQTGLQNGAAGVPGFSDFTHSAGYGDIDRDGDLDLVVGNAYGQGIYDPYVLRNDGSGAFSVVAGAIPSEIGSLTAGKYTSQELVDLNGDGAVDLVLGAENTPTSGPYIPSRILYNNGSGSFYDSGITFDGGFGTDSSAIDVDALDLNADGRNDLLVTYYRGSTFAGAYTQVLIQQPDGSFADETAARLPQTSVESSDFREWVRLADFDGDGDLDALASYSSVGGGSRAPEIWTNNGGVFSIQSLAIGGNEQIDVGDFDGNGTVDLVTYNGTYVTTYLNGAANPSVTGTAGADALTGTGFTNRISAGAGSDTVMAGAGDDLVYGNLETDTLYGEAGNDTIYGGQNDGPIDAGSAIDPPRQRYGTEYIYGGDGNDVLYGNYGSDVIDAGHGDDRVFGGQDNDTLLGGAGADVLLGNRGDDVMYGGAGYDTFRFGSALQGNDIIQDFEVGGIDRIDVADPAAVAIGSSASGAVLLTYPGGTIELVGVSQGAFDSSWLI